MSNIKNSKYKFFTIIVFAMTLFGSFLILNTPTDAAAINRNYTFTGETDWWKLKEKTGSDRNYNVIKYCRANRHKSTSTCGDITVRRANWVRSKEYGGHLECYTGEWGDASKAGTVRRNTSGTGLSNSKAADICKHAKYPNGEIFKKADNGKYGGDYAGKTWHFPTILVYSIKFIDKDNNIIGGGDTSRHRNYGYCGSDYDEASSSEGKIDHVYARITSVNNHNCTINVQAKFDMDNNKQDITGSPAVTLPYICDATFSGTSQVGEVTPASTQKLSDTRYRITGPGSDTTNIKFNHNVKRTDDNVGTAAGKVYKLNNSTFNQSASYARKDTSNTYRHDNPVLNSSITIGSTKDICEQINYSNRVWHTTSPYGEFIQNGNTLGGYIANLGSRQASAADTAKACITLERPYNFAVSELDAKIEEDTIYAGEDVNSEFEFKTDKMHDDWGTEATLPSGLKIKAVHFLVNSNVSFDTVEQKNFTSSETDIADKDLVKTLENFVKDRLGDSNISDFEELDSYLIDNNNLNSAKFNVKTAVPDLNANDQSTVGSKYCVAAISSFLNFDGLDKDIAANESKKGYISNIECRPIAKKPYLQVENSSLYSSNSIETINSSKIVGVKLGGTGNKTTFGSWSEYFLVANTGAIKNTSSGAALNNGNNESALCPLSPLAISNIGCKNGSSSQFGKSNISRDNFALAVTNYYSDDAHKDQVNTRTSDFTVDGLGSFGGKSVIMTDGNISITGDIVADNGTFISSNDVSQHIIISTDGNINIDQNVGNIDAWLIAPSGTVRTCTENGQDKDYDNNNMSSNSCNKQLVINGLVAAKDLSFKRTHGMETIAPNSGNVAAEKVIFNITAYLWSYQQATSQTGQANVVYTRELAPRQ